MHELGERRGRHPGATLDARSDSGQRGGYVATHPVKTSMAAYMTEIESWRVLPGDRIEFTMRRLPSAD